MPAIPTTCLATPLHKPKNANAPTTTRTIISTMPTHPFLSTHLFAKLYNG